MFFGWRVVAGSFAAMLLVVGFFTYAFSLFVIPLRAEFGVSLEQVMYGITLATVLGLLVTPLSGVLIDRVSLRYLMTVGCLVVAAGFWAMSKAQSMLAFNVLFAVTMSLGNGWASTMAGSAAVARWFVRHRGRALGITTIGTSVGGMAVPALVAWWLASVGWRGTLEYLALLTLLVVTPWVWLNIRGNPQEMGLQAEGQEGGRAGAASGKSSAGEQALEMTDIIKRRAFWSIAASVGLLIAVFSSVLANLSPWATQLGASPAAASRLIILLAVAGLCGKLAFGFAADRFSLKAGMWTAQGLVACALPGHGDRAGLWGHGHGGTRPRPGNRWFAAGVECHDGASLWCQQLRPCHGGDGANHHPADNAHLHNCRAAVRCQRQLYQQPAGFHAGAACRRRDVDTAKAGVVPAGLNAPRAGLNMPRAGLNAPRAGLNMPRAPVKAGAFPGYWKNPADRCRPADAPDRGPAPVGRGDYQPRHSGQWPWPGRDP